MKKKLLLGLSIVIVGAGATAVYAKESPLVESPRGSIRREYTEKELDEIHKSRVKYRKEELKELVDKNLITKEEYQYRLNRIEERDNYIEENGHHNENYHRNHNDNFRHHENGRGHRHNHNGMGCNIY